MRAPDALLFPKPEEAGLVGADLVDRDPVEAGLLPRAHGFDDRLGSGPQGTPSTAMSIVTLSADRVEVRGPRELLVDRPAETTVPPEPEDRLLRLSSVSAQQTRTCP